MKRNHSEFPLKLLAAFGALLNTAWEFAQFLFLYDMRGWSMWKGVAYMSASIAGDVLIVLGVVAASWLLFERSMSTLLGLRGRISTIALGFVAGILLEWFARVLDLWNYSSLMPTITVASVAVGLAPVIQITILPAASLWLIVLLSKATATDSA